jgi:hypothetical protein
MSRALATATYAALFLISMAAAHAGEFIGDGGLLPAGTEFGDEMLDKPREVFKSEQIHGRKPYVVNLGDIAFNSPSILGGVARQIGLSCNTCHVNGTSNPRLYIPGMSNRPGNFDTTGPLFNHHTDNGIVDPVTPPSLRGARYLWPYGHDGRLPSLRDFVHTVIVSEFSGPEPSPEILEALVAYILDIDFLPNRRLGLGGRLAGAKSDAENRGEVLFYKPFKHDPGISCATCHIPSAAFVDRLTHDVGSDGSFKTPTLLNVDFNAPYFHDGRYGTLEEVIVHFDRMFYLGLSAQDRQDLVAYVKAIGDGEQPYLRDGVEPRLREIRDFVSVLDTAIPEENKPVISLTIDAVGRELREFVEMYPDHKDTTVSGGKNERATARAALKDLVLDLRRVDVAAQDGRFEDAGAALSSYRTELAAAVPALKAAVPWSLFNPETHNAHFASVRQLYRTSLDPAVLAARRRIDKD